MTAPETRLGQCRILDSWESAPGVETLEGKIGPLFCQEEVSMHYISMPPGLYCDPHVHSSGSIIFTASGRWILCSEGKRHLMNTGSVFLMPPNIETGYEVPFTEPATIIIAKHGAITDPETFLGYLEELRQRLENQQETGTVFRFSQLQDDHPAVRFASKIDGTIV